jgi:hypothetical protein
MSEAIADDAGATADGELRRHNRDTDIMSTTVVR